MRFEANLAIQLIGISGQPDLEATEENIHVKIVSHAVRVALAGGLVAGTVAIAAPDAKAVVTNVGSCSGTKQLGAAKSTTLLSGLTDVDNQDVSIGTKGIDPTVLKGTNLGTCTFAAGLSTPDAAKPPVKGYNGTKTITKMGTKLFSPEADCNTNDTGDLTEWPLNGTIGITFSDLTGAGKNQALSAAVAIVGFTDPDNDPLTPSDVVSFRGFVTKGVAAGADVAGDVYFDPAVKDKLQTTNIPHFGYSFDIGNALGCGGAGPANITAFVNGDGTSLLLALPASGVSFSIGT